MPRLRSLALLAGAAGLVLAGCSQSVSTSDLEEQISIQFEKQVDQAPDDVTCEEELPAEKDATVQCDVTLDGETRAVDVTATAVDGDAVRFDIQLAEEEATSPSPSDDASQSTDESTATEEPSDSAEPASVSSEELTTQINAQLQRDFGKTPDDLTCPTPLPARVDAVVQCLLTDGPQKYGVTVTATAVNGSNVEFDIKVADSPMT